MPSFSMPRSRQPTLSPAWPWSSSLRNISTPVTTVLLGVASKPMISTSSPTLITPRSMRPVATVPRPLIENTSSTAIRKGLSMSRTGSGMYAVERVEQLVDRLLPLRVAVERRQRRAADDRARCRRRTCTWSAARGLPSRPGRASRRRRPRRTCSGRRRCGCKPTWRASSTCSRVCGITLSSARTTRIAPSICAAPVIMFLM